LAPDLMSDEEWAFHERVIGAVCAPNGRKPLNHRLVLDGVFWIARTGSPCRDLPEEFGTWSSVYRQFRRWTLAGLCERVMDALNESGLVPDALQITDIGPGSATGSNEPAKVVRAHRQAARCHPLRQNRRERPRLHRHHVDPPVAPPIANMT
jgi:transposase